MSIIAHILPSQVRGNDGIGKCFLKDERLSMSGHQPHRRESLCHDANTSILQPSASAVPEFRELCVEFLGRSHVVGGLVGATNGTGGIILGWQCTNVADAMLTEFREKCRMGLLDVAVDLGGVNQGSLASLLGWMIAVKKDILRRRRSLSQFVMEGNRLVGRSVGRESIETVCEIGVPWGRDSSACRVHSAAVPEQTHDSFAVKTIS